MFFARKTSFFSVPWLLNVDFSKYAESFGMKSPHKFYFAGEGRWWRLFKEVFIQWTRSMWSFFVCLLYLQCLEFRRWTNEHCPTVLKVWRVSVAKYIIFMQRYEAFLKTLTNLLMFEVMSTFIISSSLWWS